MHPSSLVDHSVSSPLEGGTAVICHVQLQRGGRDSVQVHVVVSLPTRHIKIHLLLPPSLAGAGAPSPHPSHTKSKDWSIYNEIGDRLASDRHIMGDRLRSDLLQRICARRVNPGAIRIPSGLARSCHSHATRRWNPSNFSTRSPTNSKSRY